MSASHSENIEHRKIEAPEGFLTPGYTLGSIVTLFGDKVEAYPQAKPETSQELPQHKVEASEGFLTKNLYPTWKSFTYADPDITIRNKDKKYSQALVITPESLYTYVALRRFQEDPDDKREYKTTSFGRWYHYGELGNEAYTDPRTYEHIKQVDKFIEELHAQDCAVVLMYDHPQNQQMGYWFKKENEEKMRVSAENIFKRGDFDALVPNPYSNYTMNKKYKSYPVTRYNKYDFDWVNEYRPRIDANGNAASFGALARELGVDSDKMKVVVDTQEKCDQYKKEYYYGNRAVLLEPPRCFGYANMYDLDTIQERRIKEIKRNMQPPKSLEELAAASGWKVVMAI